MAATSALPAFSFRTRDEGATKKTEKKTAEKFLKVRLSGFSISGILGIDKNSISIETEMPPIKM
jgi:hypothetical protein